MYGGEDEENNDFYERLYTVCYNDEESSEQNPGNSAQDSDIDSEEVDRLYSNIYHEVPGQSSILEQSTILEESTILRESDISDKCGISSTASEHSLLIQHKTNSSLPISKDVSDKLHVNVGKKGTHIGKSILRPDLKTMLLDRNVDIPDSDCDDVEIIYSSNIKTISIDRDTKVKELKTLNRSDSVVESKSCSIKTTSGKCEMFKEKRSDKFQTSKPDVSSELQNNRIDVSSDSSFCKDKNKKLQSKFITISNDRSPSKNKLSKKKQNCITVSSDSSCEHKNTKKHVIQNANIPNTAAVVVIDDSSDAESSSDASTEYVASLVAISSDLSSKSSLSTSSELSDSSSESCSENSLEPKGNLQINVNRSQQHLLDVTMDENFKCNLKEKKVLWEICDRDQFGGKTLYGRYYQPSTVRCQNCKYVGHMSKHCPQPKKTQVCILCGLGGHYFRKCPNSLCYNCDAPSHDGKACSERCRKRDDLCNRCGMQGHWSHVCPDIWRQYHLTTTSDLKVPNKKGKRNPRVYCYNCARAQHFGHECHRVRQNYYSLPTYPFIAHYGDFTENDKQKGFKKQKLDGVKETFRSSSEVDFPRSLPKPTLPKQIFDKKRKCHGEAVENGIATKRYKADKRELPENQVKNRKKKRQKNFKNAIKGHISKEAKNVSSKIGGQSGKMEEITAQNSRHQVYDNKWWTAKYKLREERKKKKKEKRKQRILENPHSKKKKKKKTSTNIEQSFKMANQKCLDPNKTKSTFKSDFKNSVTKPKLTARGFFISRVAQAAQAIVNR